MELLLLFIYFIDRYIFYLFIVSDMSLLINNQLKGQSPNNNIVHKLKLIIVRNILTIINFLQRIFLCKKYS